MRRRIFIIVGGCIGLAVLVALTVPWWLGALLRSTAPRVGVTFSDYTRVGYGRFLLKDVVYRGSSFQATATRVEFATPVAWAWRRASGNGSDVQIGKWALTLEASAEKSTPKDPNATSGWMPLRRQVRDAIEKVEPWLQSATLGEGVIKTPTATVAVAGIAWHDRTLSLQRVRFQEREVDAEITLYKSPDEIRVAAATRTDEAKLTLTSLGAGVTGEVAWWGQPARLTAEFPPQNWIPTQAQLTATDWNVPAERAKLGNHYAAIRGGARLLWADGRVSLELNATSTPLTENNSAPPLELAVRGAGDLQAFTIQQLRAKMPGANAELSAPVTITRSGEIQDAPAQFTTTIDLAQLPWIDAVGAISGTIEVAARTPDLASPSVDFQLNATDVAAAGVSLRSGALRGRVEWPRIEISEAILVGGNAEELRITGGWDFTAKEARDVAVTGELRHETFARWLPKNIAFSSVNLDASASGPVAQLQHRGRVQVADVKAATLKPLQVALDWSGTGRAAERIQARITAGDSHLAFTAAADLESVRITELEFAPRGEPPLRLTQPALVRWKPRLQIDNLALASEKSRVYASVVWGESGNAKLAFNQIPSTWLADFVTLPGPAWTLSSLAVNGAWDRGPLAFEAIVGATAVLREDHRVRADLHLRGDKNGVRLVALNARDNGAAVLTASGRAPAVLTLGKTPGLHIDPTGEVELKLTTTENRVFWDEIGKLAGVTVDAPRVTANITGTWREPEGELRAVVPRVSFAPKNGKALPPIEAVDIALTADSAGVVVERLLLAVQNQPLRASGRLPFPQRGWEELRKDPLGYARRGAQFQLEVPAAELAAFEALLPPKIVPQGTVEARVAFRDGAMEGGLVLRNAATLPIGTLGALHDIQAKVQLQGDSVRLESVTAELAGAPIRIAGTVTLPPLETIKATAGAGGAGGLPKIDVTIKAVNLPLVRKAGTIVRADLDVALVSPPDATPLVQGTVRLRDSLFLQDMRDLIPSGTKSKSERPPFFAVEAEPFANWRLDVRVAGDEFMRLRTTLFNGTASADFRLGGTLGEPTLLGEATIDRGEVRLPFATFSVEEGRVALTPAQPHQPEIFVTATARRFEYDLRMEVSGSASAPTLTFESTPPLEHGQILLMVTAGVVPNNTVAISQEQRASRLGSYLGQSLLSSLGEGGDSSRLTVTSGEDISEQGRETYDLEYSLNKRWSLTAEYDEFDSHTLGVKWRALRRGGTRLAGSGTESNSSGETGGGSDAPASGLGAGEPATTSESASASDQDRGKKPKPAKLDVSGLGFIADFEMEGSLKRLLGDAHGPLLDSRAIEDALFLLLSAVRERGYLRPSVRVDVLTEDGIQRELTVDTELTTRVPRDLQARAVEFRVDRGLHYFLDEFQINGLSAVDPDTARAYFSGRPGILKRQKSATFTPGRLKRGVASLEAALRERGYPEAKITATDPRIDHETGKVAVSINVVEGPVWQIASVDVEGAADGVKGAETLAGYTGQPWSESAEQDIAAEVRKKHLQQGYADARVRLSRETRSTGNDAKVVEMVARVTPGARVTIGQVRFEGNVKTRDAVLNRRVPFGPGDPLNPLDVQQARHRISRLGVFEDVDVQLEPTDGAVRDVVFNVKPGRQLELNLLAGYNSYEQLRAGVEVRQYNLWGRAHQTRGLLAQSMKSTRAEYSYTVPELFGENVHGTARLTGLQREEVAFVRKEYGARFAVDTPLRFLDANLTAGYSFEVLRNTNNELQTRAIDQNQVEVASVELGLTRDRRDNPLLPRKGYRWFGRLEAASKFLGGRAEYQRAEFGGTYHRPWGTGRWLHFGLAHGVVMTLGRDDEQLPVNRRFFPGGDGSIRGYQLGEAAPRGDDGRFVGAKSYLNASAEFEQTLVDKLSGVFFVDALGSAAQLATYPFDAVLLTVGLGLRYETLIGPVRAEYGHNLNPRPRDPRGTVHLTIGFPF